MDNRIYIQDLGDSGKPKGNPDMAEIGTKEDGTVVKMFSIGEKMYALKEISLYELASKKANSAPDKSNNEPKVVQKLVINKGPDSDFVSKTLLTAKSVFQHGHFKNEIREEIFKLCIETLFEFSVLIESIETYNKIEDQQILKFQNSPKTKENFVIPSIPDIRTRAKTIFHKIDQISQHLIAIIQLFYPADKRKSGTPFEQLYDHFRSKYGEDDVNTIYLRDNLDFFCHMRFIRNGLDHAKAKFVNIEDFKYESNALNHPMISLNRSECSFKNKEFRYYINEELNVLPFIFENIIVMIAGDNIINNAFAFEIREIPMGNRIFPKVRYAFWSPVGTNGFFNLNF